MTPVLIGLALIFAQLSMVAFGGGLSILPEMQRQVVDVNHWITAQQFGALYALAQAAPGPNLMVVTLLGWKIAGWPGAMTTSAMMFGPPSLLTGVVVNYWERFKDRPWRRMVQAGFLPLTAGLVASGATIMAVNVAHEWINIGIVAVSTAIMLGTRLHPLWVLAGGALIGLSGIGQL